MADKDFKHSTGEFDQRARADFDAAHRQGNWRALLSWIIRKNNQLIPFDELQKNLPLHGQHYAGIQQIEVNKVIGSVGRYQDFDRIFLPRQTRTQGRWMSIDRAHLQEINLPPIEVYQIGGAYFVKDGNHRVSVARQRGQVFIDAVVIKIDIPIPMDASTSIDDLIGKKELAEFLVQTRLHHIRPDIALPELTVPGGYQKLLEHIHVHRWYLGEQRQNEPPWDEAVASWYDNVYLPLVTEIRQNQILKAFPDRSEADLYLWIIEHLGYLRQEQQIEVSPKDAARHFVTSFAGSRLHQFLIKIGLARSPAKPASPQVKATPKSEPPAKDHPPDP